MMTWMASSLLPRSGANPPSSPTAVLSFFFLSTSLSPWYTSAQMRRASSKLPAPTGMTMNSCRSTLLSACLPPFMMFIMGTGSVKALTPPTYW